MEAIFDTMREFYAKIDPDTLVKTALSFKFSRKLIDKLELEYQEKPDEDLMALCYVE